MKDSRRHQSFLSPPVVLAWRGSCIWSCVCVCQFAANLVSCTLQPYIFWAHLYDSMPTWMSRFTICEKNFLIKGGCSLVGRAGGLVIGRWLVWIPAPLGRNWATCRSIFWGSVYILSGKKYFRMWLRWYKLTNNPIAQCVMGFKTTKQITLHTLDYIFKPA